MSWAWSNYSGDKVSLDTWREMEFGDFKIMSGSMRKIRGRVLYSPEKSNDG